MKAAWDFEPSTEFELPFRQDEILEVFEDDDPNWWFVKGQNGTGLVPSSYLLEIKNEQKVEHVETFINDEWEEIKSNTKRKKKEKKKNEKREKRKKKRKKRQEKRKRKRKRKRKEKKRKRKRKKRKKKEK